MSAYLFTKAAEHLNNVGIELFVLGCHRQAIETFQGAVKVMQFSSNTPHPLSHGKSSSLAAPGALEDHDRIIQIEEMLNKSAKWLAEPVPTQGGQGNATNLIVISDEHDPLLIALNALSSTTACLIRIESIGHESTMNDDVAVKAAIILYNYGACYQSLALYTLLPTQTQLQMGAFQMFRLAFNTLLLLQSERNRAQDMSWSQCGCLTFLLILRQLIGVTRLLNMSTESEQYTVHLDYFKNLLQGLHHMKQDMFTTEHARAA